MVNLRTNYLLRALYRKLAEQGRPLDYYYEYLLGHITRGEPRNHLMVSDAARMASEEARCATLGGPEQNLIDKWIASSLGRSAVWVLIGGPPCQAYSLVGRPRMRNINPEKFEQDERHFLYREYLRVIARYRPPVFVMENVKGLLSSTHGGRHIFQRILADLRKPGRGLEYEIRSFNASGDCSDPRGYIIHSECHGVPQIRHRVILFGIRKDLSGVPHRPLARQVSANNVATALAGLPPLRSRISQGQDNFSRWINILAEAGTLLKGWRRKEKKEIEDIMTISVAMARKADPGFGSNVIVRPLMPAGTALADWYSDRHLGLVLNHESRSHMPADLQRYLFAAAYAQIVKQSHTLAVFPRKFLPDHRNVNGNVAEIPFDDRFRVQVWKNPSSTVVSHIAKDGHYYIHPDPIQCRSLTLREAARLQTFQPVLPAGGGSQPSGPCTVKLSTDRSTILLMDASSSTERKHVSLGEDRVQKIFNFPDSAWSVAIYKIRGAQQYGFIALDLTNCEEQMPVDVPSIASAAAFDQGEVVLSLEKGEQRFKLRNQTTQ